MRALPAVAAAVLAIATPSLANAQELADEAPEAALADLSDKLSDPQFQDQAASMAQIFLSTMLDLEIGPLADAMNQATGGQGPDIDSDARIRDLAPEAEELPDEVGERLPQAMSAMGAMAEGMQQMIPAFLDMADRMRGAMEQGADIDPSE